MAVDIARDWNIEEVDRRPALGSRVWPRLSEERLKAKFPLSELRVADERLVLMTDSDNNVPLFEYLLTEGYPFVVECDMRNRQFWHATRVGKCFGATEAKVRNIATKEEETILVEVRTCHILFTKYNILYFSVKFPNKLYILNLKNESKI